MLFSTSLNTRPYRWRRQVSGRSERLIDERRITIDARPNGENALVLSGGVHLEELKLQVQIFDLQPGTIAIEVERPPETIGWLQYLEEYDCLAGWFCVGPINFDEI
jgi:hypothetical protein